MADAKDRVQAHIETQIRQLQEKIKSAETRAEEHRACVRSEVADVEQFRYMVSVWTAALTRVSVSPHQACDASANVSADVSAESGDGSGISQSRNAWSQTSRVGSAYACVFKNCPDPSGCGAECKVPAGSHAAHRLVLRIGG